jgi:hypothetical protein
MVALFQYHENKKREQNVETADEVEGNTPDKEDKAEEASDGQVEGSEGGL